MDCGTLLPLLLSLLAVPARAAEPAPSPPWLRLVEPLPCSAAIERQLSDWRVTSEVLRAPSGIDGRPVYRIATERLGTWVTLVPAPEGGTGTRLYHTNATRTVTVSLDARCRARRSELPLPTPARADADAFTDHDLETLLSRHPSSIVYLWSPHLPLSVEGYREAARAAEARGLGFAAVVHPSADPAFVRERAEAEGIPPESCQKLASVELLFRDFALHAPTLLSFRGGHAGSPLPGYRSATGYLEYLDGLAAESAPDAR